MKANGFEKYSFNEKMASLGHPRAGTEALLTVKSFESHSAKMGLDQIASRMMQARLSFLPLADRVSDHQKHHHTDHIRDEMLVGLGEWNSAADGSFRVISAHLAPSKLWPNDIFAGTFLYPMRHGKRNGGLRPAVTRVWTER